MSVIELDARYCLVDGLSASVTIECNLEQLNAGLVQETYMEKRQGKESDSQVVLTLIHECFVGEVVSHDFLDTFTLPLTVHLGESLTVIARYEGRIIGSLVNEVNTAEDSRVLMLPKGGYNVIVYQERRDQSGQTAPAASLDQVVTLLLAARDPGARRTAQEDLHPLKTARLLRGWSQTRVADALNTTIRTVSRWEQGRVLPYPFYREQLCQLFGKNARQLGLLPDDTAVASQP